MEQIPLTRLPIKVSADPKFRYVTKRKQTYIHSNKRLTTPTRKYTCQNLRSGRRETVQHVTFSKESDEFFLYLRTLRLNENCNRSVLILFLLREVKFLNLSILNPNEGGKRFCGIEQ